MENARIVLAAVQRGGSPGIADDAARRIAGYGFPCVWRTRHLQAAAAVQNALVDAVLRAVYGVAQCQMLAPADHAADIGIGGKVQRVGAFVQRYGCCAFIILLADRQNVVGDVHCRQQEFGAGDGVAFRGHRLNDLIVADNAARQRLGLQSVAAAVRAKTRCGHTFSNHIGTQHAAHAVAPGNQLCLNGNGGQCGAAVQAYQTAHGVLRAGNAPADRKGGRFRHRNRCARIVKADHAAHKAAAVQQGADCGSLRPLDGTRVIARHAADKICVVAICHSLQQLYAAGVGGSVGGGRRRAVGQRACVIADNAARVGCIFSERGGHTGVAHTGNGAVFAVEGHHAAHIAVTKHVAAVGGAIAQHRAAGKPADHAADKGVAQHIAAAGFAAGNGYTVAKADQPADEIALQGGGRAQRAAVTIAVCDQGFDVVLAQAAAGAAVAVFQRGVFHHTCHAAEELPQHAAFARRVAVIARQRQHTARVVEVGYGGFARRFAAQVARHTAGVGVAADLGRVIYDIYRAGFLQREYTEHTAHADGAVDAGCCYAGSLGGFVGGGGGGGFGAAVLPDTRHSDIFFHRKVF